jgi:cytochrome b involved in lipid metabolism
MNTNKTIGIIVGVVIVIAGAFAIVKSQHADTDTSYTPDTTTSAPSESINPSAGKPSTGTPKPTTTAGTYTAAQVATHSNASDCWTIVNGGVYNVTSWISKHPGGQAAIKGMCGIDASAQFNDQHGGQGGPERVLASFKIGALVK